MALGATKVEFGVQILHDDILRAVRRGHLVKEIVDATKRSKDAGLKVAYHVMPGLPGSDREKDLASFRKVFEDERFRPDMLKIYPTLVVKGTGLYDDWSAGRYRPMTVDETVDLLVEVKKSVPPWVRILRIQRDIPIQLIEDGVRKSHLRELVMEELKARGERCRCIRCREVGHLPTGKDAPKESDVELAETVYRASGGEEHFISFEVPSSDSLVGYARLRIPGSEGPGAALVRELHVYGQMVPFSERRSGAWQHKGFGERLLAECERKAVEAGLSEVKVTSGVGARSYYRRLGYVRNGCYMTKIPDSG